MMRRTLNVCAVFGALAVVPAPAHAQFEWVNKLFEKIDGFNLFAAFPLGAVMDSDELVPRNFHEFGFELVIDILGGDGSGSGSSSTPTSQGYAQCLGGWLFPVLCDARWGPQLPLRSTVVPGRASYSVRAGKKRQLTVDVYDEHGRKNSWLPGEPQPVIRWLSLDDTLATVNASGEVTGVKKGTARIVACVDAEDSKNARYHTFTHDACTEFAVTVTQPARELGLEVAVGYEYTSGFEARDPSLDIEGSIQTFPTVSLYIDPDFPRLQFLYFGLSVGLAKFWNTRALLPGTQASSVVLDGQSFEVGVAVGAEVHGIFLEAAYRRREFRALRWMVAGAEIAPPPNWPRSIDMNTVLFRVGIASSNLIGGN